MHHIHKDLLTIGGVNSATKGGGVYASPFFLSIPNPLTLRETQRGLLEVDGKGFSKSLERIGEDF